MHILIPLGRERDFRFWSGTSEMVMCTKWMATVWGHLVQPN